MENIKVIFDIETVPNLPKEEIISHLETIGDNEELQSEFMKKYILSPVRNKIVSISTVVLIPDEKPSFELFFSTDNESEVINGFYDMLCDIKSEGYDFTLVGFNINFFDIPVFKAKAGKYVSESKRKKLLNLKPWESFDIFEFIGKRESLVEWLEFYNLPKKYNGLTGADFLNLYINDDVDSMKKYSYQDAISEAKLYKQLENI